MPDCCPAITPPSAAAYKRHLRANTLPCGPAQRDSAAYRLSRKHKGAR